MHSYWTWFLKKKNEIIMCNNDEAIAVFKHSSNEEFLARDLSHYKPKTMPVLEMVTRFCFGEDTWLAEKRSQEESGLCKVNEGNEKYRRSRNNKCRNFPGSDGEDVDVNAQQPSSRILNTLMLNQER